ncbi:MAG: hypothetical protein RJA81_1281 [Planctomycetota bacterium]|jgi:adenylate cyclase class 2
MAYEIEAKFRLPDKGQILVNRLEELGASSAPGYVVSDVYLKHPSRDFAQTGEAFRLRREADSFFLTYKGPKLTTAGVKSRQEIEIGLLTSENTAGEALLMFESLGFTQVLKVEKFRTPYSCTFQGRPFTVVLDDAGQLGFFAEIEIVLENETQMEQSEELIRQMGQFLGLTDYEPRSYLRMWLEKQQMI